MKERQKKRTQKVCRIEVDLVTKVQMQRQEWRPQCRKLCDTIDAVRYEYYSARCAVAIVVIW